MTFFFRFCFFVFPIACHFTSLIGTQDVTAIKGETCSPRGPPEDGEDDKNPCFKDRLYSAFSDVRLPRRDAVAVGHVESIQLDEEKSVQLTTRSVKPPIFEIPDLLSSDECDHFVELAKRNGLEESETAGKSKGVTREGTNATLTEELMIKYCKRINRYDNDKDGSITMMEFAGYVYYITRMLVRTSDLWTVYQTLLPEGAHVITYKNCTKLNRTQFVEFIYQLFNMNRLSYYKDRYSEHSWVELNDKADKDPVLKRVKRRIAEVTQMSVLQIEHSEDLQVVKYQRGGHYHAHYDSSVSQEMIEKRCCGKFQDIQKSTCLLCRYITILFFLNNVTEGGETAFPVADREELFVGQNYSTNLSKHCNRASLVVKPVKGSALLWYNNVLDEESGKMGEVDMLTLHGGCDVIEGEKWIANLWLNAPRGDQTV